MSGLGKVLANVGAARTHISHYSWRIWHFYFMTIDPRCLYWVELYPGKAVVSSDTPMVGYKAVVIPQLGRARAVNGCLTRRPATPVPGSPRQQWRRTSSTRTEVRL